MNADRIIAALQLPPGCLVGQRVAKKLLVEHGATTAADKRRINEGLEDLYWVAALKPNTVGVPALSDEVREYLEISVLRASLRDAADATRLVALIHRAIPYPVLLLTEQSEREMRPELSAAHKRRSQRETGMTVLDGEVVAVEWDEERWPRLGDAFTLSKQPRASLYVLFQGWIDALLALQVAHVTGTFRLADSAAHATLRRTALKDLVLLNAEAAGLRANAAKEKQMSRRVKLNLELKRVEVALAAARANL
ncbi:DUF4391 domain-containing protein [Gemmatimonas sp.]|uniref:DUF4391 domain-containing protein n=1 Tax=Gemmatimonas sp. TaxID=1962908 RepID=UPI003F725F78